MTWRTRSFRLGSPFTLILAVLIYDYAQAAGAELFVKLEARITDGRRPIVIGTTNLPNGTRLLVNFRSPTASNSERRASLGLSICGDDGCRQYGPTDQTGQLVMGTEVTNGSFAYGPITDDGNELKPGRYALIIEADAYPGVDGSGYLASQPPEVLRVLGPKGVNMVGPLVGGCCFELPEPYRGQAQEQARQRWGRTGAWVYYAREVQIR